VHPGGNPRNGPADKHVNDCASLVQPFSKPDEMDFVAASLFADKQKRSS
jgi:hypothetical protein